MKNEPNSISTKILAVLSPDYGLYSDQIAERAGLSTKVTTRTLYNLVVTEKLTRTFTNKRWLYFGLPKPVESKKKPAVMVKLPEPAKPVIDDKVFSRIKLLRWLRERMNPSYQSMLDIVLKDYEDQLK